MTRTKTLDLFSALVLPTAVVLSSWAATPAWSDEPAPAAAAQEHAGGPAATPPRLAGAIVETMDAGGYTYVQIETAGGRVWAAGPPRKVTVGDTIDLPPGMPMAQFHSNKLDRTFDMIYFVPSLGPTDAAGTEPPAGKPNATGLPFRHGPIPSAPQPAPAKDPSPAVDVGSIAIPDGGTTIEELYARKAELAGQTVLVRGKVVKFNTGIMKTNWLHLRDGTGDAGSNDLTVTTDAQAAVGDTVLVKGALTLDKDFGAGYRYDLLVEHATVTVE